MTGTTHTTPTTDAAQRADVENEIRHLLDALGTQAEGLMPEVVRRLAQELEHRTASEQRYAELYRRERAARIEAEDANRAKDRFLALVVHELRTPLNAIVGWTELAKMGVSGDAEIQEALTRIETSARVQAQLISDLLDVARIASGKLTIQMDRVDLLEVIDAAVETVRPTANAKHICLTANVHGEPVVVSGDALRLQQLIWNLLSNAVKFTPPEGIVRVLVERSACQVTIRVMDNGQGITPEFLPQLFQQYRQEGRDAYSGHKGLGLGLSIVRQIAEAHGGSVEAESAGRGQGATFVVTLPLAR